MIAKIKHVAFMSHNAPRLCRFYECLFGLTRARADTSPASEEEFAKDTSRNRFAVLLSRTNHLSYHLGQAVLGVK